MTNVMIAAVFDITSLKWSSARALSWSLRTRPDPSVLMFERAQNTHSANFMNIPILIIMYTTVELSMLGLCPVKPSYKSITEAKSEE